MTVPATTVDRLQDLLGALPHLLWTCTADGCCDLLSAQWASYVGAVTTAAPDDAWWAAVHPDDEGAARAAWATALTAQQAFEVEVRLRRVDGVFRWFKVHVVPRLDEDGAVVRWAGNGTDIDELRAVRATKLQLRTELESMVAARTLELQRTTDRLQVLTLQLRTAQRITRVGSWQFDISSGDVIWSDELFRIFRMKTTSEPPNYKVQAGLFEPEAWARLTAAIDHSVASGEGYELSLGIVREDGDRGTAIARAEVVTDEHGNVVRLVGTFQDITERERVYQELRRQTDRLQLATSAARMGVWDWDVAADTLIWDEAMLALYGVSAKDGRVDASLWARSLHPDDREATLRDLREALGGGRAFDTTFRIVTSGGDLRHVKALALVHNEVAGQRVVGVNQDITQQRTAELALQRSEALRRAIVDHAGPLFIATDINGTITLFNKAAEALLGYRAAELVGWATPLMFHDPVEVQERRQAMEAGQQRQLGDAFEVFVARARVHGIDANEWTYVGRNGARVPVLLTVTPLRNDRGEISGYLGVAVNLSARKQEEQDLLRLNALLSERSAQTEVLLQEVHHRVKNNLQVIASLMNMQIRKVTDSGARAALQECRSRVDGIALIHEQLYQSKDYARVPFSEYSKKLIHNIFHASGTTPENIALTVDVDPVALTVDKAIPCGLILNELITNSLKHAFVGGRRGTLHVSLRETVDREAVLTVADDGVGMTGEHTTRSTSSMGMQLIHTLVKQLGGRLEVVGGNGTQATLSFPMGARSDE